MIFVGPLRTCRGPWGGKLGCDLISDESEYELVRFAEAISVNPVWLRRGSGNRPCPRFTVSPRHRARAIQFGAVESDEPAMVEAFIRYRDRKYGPPRGRHVDRRR